MSLTIEQVRYRLSELGIDLKDTPITVTSNVDIYPNVILIHFTAGNPLFMTFKKDDFERTGWQVAYAYNWSNRWFWLSDEPIKPKAVYTIHAPTLAELQKNWGKALQDEDILNHDNIPAPRILTTAYGSIFLKPDNQDSVELIDATIRLALKAGDSMDLPCGDALHRAMTTIERESILLLDSFGVSGGQLRKRMGDGYTFTQAFHDLLAAQVGETNEQ